MQARRFVSVLLPFVACALQWLLWDDYIKPYVWFLFFPAAFFSAWIGGLVGGLAATVIGALLILFAQLGSHFFYFFERLRRAIRLTDKEPDRLRSDQMRANRFVRKPLDFSEFAETVARLGIYWVATNEAPPNH